MQALKGHFSLSLSSLLAVFLSTPFSYNHPLPTISHARTFEHVQRKKIVKQVKQMEVWHTTDENWCYYREGDIPGTQQMRTGVVPERTWYSTYTATEGDASNTGHNKGVCCSGRTRRKNNKKARL
ncbi:hypothetical protein EDB83DRAFT_2316219 [Lactarius deliciosus]|nr:hypothetical protein EDB83DRAFT_2316219 [Lactarius deliciosus]